MVFLLTPQKKDTLHGVLVGYHCPQILASGKGREKTNLKNSAVSCFWSECTGKLREHRTVLLFEVLRFFLLFIVETCFESDRHHLGYLK